MGERIAAIKCIVSNTCHTVRNINMGERIAAIKCTVSNTRYAVWNINLGERIAVTKCIVSNTRRSAFLHDNSIRGIKSRIAPVIMILQIGSCINRTYTQRLIAVVLNPRFYICKAPIPFLKSKKVMVYSLIIRACIRRRQRSHFLHFFDGIAKK